MGAVSEIIEKERLSHAVKTTESHKKDFGQYLTPYNIAKYMSSLFPKTKEDLNILDPGAGIGTLSCALLERIKSEKWNNSKVNVTTYEFDKTVLKSLKENLETEGKDFSNYSYQIFGEDFLEKTSFEYSFGTNEQFTHVIMNPPYKKILTKSAAREYTRVFGLETVNLYSAFVGASIAQLKEKGYLVAIVPRSFCNGSYYKPFREFILKNCSIKHIHLFESRNKAFKDESVLQENIIIMLQKETEQSNVDISYSSDAVFSDLQTETFEFGSIVNPSDKEKYFNIPLPSQKNKSVYFENGHDFISLKETGTNVSTGTIVDFRTKDYIRKEPEENTVPLLYPVHFRHFRTDWPKESKKPNAILIADKTAPMFAPAGFYVVVKRFSTKEEQKRIVASLISAEDINTPAFAFENHLNVFHENKKGLPKDIAYGLTVWLNTTFLDEQFRLFSGHTQVNATDLRNLPYPTKSQLVEMGKQLEKYKVWNQQLFDSIAMESINEKRRAVNF
ncbi:Eco57I restriction-modification methylase domain-containing protein [Treponema sp.]|uniref:Eco57I restriction-modification methylase domain-containing protein n=1 Tax=Treponema sp. TaxID=166 RepID=UPI003FD785AC